MPVHAAAAYLTCSQLLAVKKSIHINISAGYNQIHHHTIHIAIQIVTIYITLSSITYTNTANTVKVDKLTKMNEWKWLVNVPFWWTIPLNQVLFLFCLHISLLPFRILSPTLSLPYSSVIQISSRLPLSLPSQLNSSFFLSLTQCLGGSAVCAVVWEAPVWRAGGGWSACLMFLLALQRAALTHTARHYWSCTCKTGA